MAGYLPVGAHIADELGVAEGFEDAEDVGVVAVRVAVRLETAIAFVGPGMVVRYRAGWRLPRNQGNLPQAM